MCIQPAIKQLAYSRAKSTKTRIETTIGLDYELIEVKFESKIH
ncbi:hypothetical protein [Methanosarcina horonobensis]|nr:hypothetical protein [Methanosarcina horonobensis]